MIKPGRLEGCLPDSHIFFTARVDIDWLVQRLPSALICSSHRYLNWYQLSYSTPPWRLKPGTGSGPAFRARQKDSLWGPAHRDNFRVKPWNGGRFWRAVCLHTEGFLSYWACAQSLHWQWRAAVQSALPEPIQSSGSWASLRLSW